jgi:HlyD family secretion protein
MNRSFRYFLPYALIFVSLLLVVACKSKPDGIKPKTKPLIEAVYASGFIVSKNEYQIFSQVEGSLSEKLVSEGEEVSKGQPLFVIEAGQQSARYNIARETFSQASRNLRDDSPVLRELTAARESAHHKYRFDSLNLVRYTNLLSQNATTRVEYDRIKLLNDNSYNDYVLQSSRLERTKNQLQLDLENARNQLVIAGNESGRYVVRSDFDGMVFMTAKEKGELIRRNELIGVVGKDDAYAVQLSVDELDIQKVKAGQKVLIKIDAYPTKVFTGKITKVFPMVDRKLQSVRADASLDEKLPGLFSGLALEANIVIREKENAVVIPKDKILPGDSVIVKTDDGNKKIKVKTGIETLDEVEIVEGVDTSNFIVEN